MLKRAIIVVTVVGAVLLSVLLITTTPSSTGPAGILSFFVLLYLTALGVLTFLFRGVSAVTFRNPLVKSKKVYSNELSLQKSYYYASIVALAPVMLIAMQSVGQIGIYQILLVVFFVVIGWVYVANRTA